jgi:2-polyprenyl-6-methoxyphenol hydroxylase-like FAD-dependent oxidoreductase
MTGKILLHTPGVPVDVLVVGAGPTGLMLALWLARLGVRVRIVDRTGGPGTTSRALVVHARTLEFYRQLGIAEEALEHGVRFEALTIWTRGEKAGRVVLGDIGKDLTPEPYLLINSQDQTERILIEALRKQGVEVDRDTELVSFEDRGDRVSVRLKGRAGEEQVDCAWLAGCDGAHSTVREALQVGFPGGTYEHMFYVADIHGRGPAINGDVNVALDRSDFLGVFPLPGEGNARLIGTVKESAEKAGDELAWEDVSADILERLRFEVERVNWFSTYHVHHRVASHFRRGRIFLLGDAAHIHSPVGAQGMNTGLGDAVNLAWKLAMVLEGRAPDAVLDTYETERIAFAQRLVATTDRAFTFVSQDGPMARMVRLELVPRILPQIMAHETARRFMFRTISQIEIEYRSSALSSGRAGEVHGGDRLPWIPDNFAPLASLEWQAHVYGDARPGIGEACRSLDLPLHVFPWTAMAERAGVARGAIYLVRPDGYVALADANPDAASLREYFTKRGMKSSTPLGKAA